MPAGRCQEDSAGWMIDFALYIEYIANILLYLEMHKSDLTVMIWTTSKNESIMYKLADVPKYIIYLLFPSSTQAGVPSIPAMGCRISSVG